MCEARDKIEAAVIVDHIIPKDVCPDPWDESNWQGLCRKDHAIKSARDKKYFKK
jgi:5-methylcytosine-specific restriction endonuclease McrA